jgi:hypothetical protein
MMRRWVEEEEEEEEENGLDGKFDDLCEGNWSCREGKAKEVEAIDEVF